LLKAGLLENGCSAKRLTLATFVAPAHRPGNAGKAA
jgi:hypothetical protein